MMAAAPSQPISIGRLPPPQAHSLLSANHPDHHQHTSNTSNSGTSPGYSYLGADLAAQNPRWAGTSASPARTTQELSTSWTIHPGPLFVSSPHHSNINSNAASSSSGVHQQNQNGAYNAGLGVSGSFTGGTPMSLSSSFYQRFLPTSSSYNNNSGSGPGVLNPLDPTEFKFSSSPYGARAGWGGGGWGGSGSYQRGFSGSYGRGGAWGVGSAESDRMSFIENYYGAKLEKEAVSKPYHHRSSPIARLIYDFFCVCDYDSATTSHAADCASRISTPWSSTSRQITRTRTPSCRIPWRGACRAPGSA